MNLREKIFSADDITKELVQVPEWGVAIELRSMTANERAGMTERASRGNDGKVDIKLMYALTLIATVYDPESGMPLFTEADKEALLSKNGAVVERLATKAMGVSGMADKAVEEATARFHQES
jgi:hypothetical protein